MITLEMKNSPTIQDISRETGLSYSSVAKILRDKPGFNSNTRRRVLQIADSVGYRPNWLSKALRSGKSMTVGIAVYSRGASIAHLRISATENAANKNGYRSYLVHPGSDGKPNSLVCLRDLIDRRVDGIVAYVGRKVPPGILEFLENSDVPHVFVDHAPQGVSNVVKIDREHGIIQVVNHLKELGHRKVGILCGQPVDGTTDAKQEMYCNYLEQAGMETLWSCVWQHGTEQSASVNLKNAYHVIRNAMEGHSALPSAIIASNDGGALAVLAVAQDMKLRVPEDMAIVGFDGLEFTQMTRPDRKSVV